MPFLDVHGDKVHYFDEAGADATAPLALLVHGSCGGGGQWKRMAEALAPEFRVIRIDLPGMGASEPYPLARKWTFDVDERAVTALIVHLDRPFHFVGHSSGGVVSWRVLQTCADRVLSCSLYEPVFFGLARDASHPCHDFIERMRAGIVERVDAGDLEGAIAFFVDHWAGAGGAWAAMPEKIKASMRVGAGRLYHECIAYPAFEREPAPPPMAPTLLIEGVDTHPAMHAIHDLLETRWRDVSRRRIPGAGHMGPFTHPGEVASAVREHILGVSPA
jgi:pimeloyl-ACP methyl ester carboxylesterase